MEHVELIRLIQNVGFPIVMVAYFVLRFERILRENTEVLRQLIIAVQTAKQNK